MFINAIQKKIFRMQCTKKCTVLVHEYTCNSFRKRDILMHLQMQRDI